MKLFDAHCHLQLPQYDADRSAVLARMQEKEMGAIVVGTDYETSKAAVELAQQHNFLWAAVGLHPNDNIDEDFAASKYELLAQNKKVVAIGECGLDYFRSGATEAERVTQKKRFEAQMQLALTVGKPLIIHCRDPLILKPGAPSAHADLQKIVLSYSQELQNKHIAAIVHFFTGTAQLAQTYLDMGCYLSFPGPITYTDMYDESVRVTPIERILSETDSPFAPPVPHRGKRNEPAYVEEVVKKMAQIKGISAIPFSNQIVENARRVFLS